MSDGTSTDEDRPRAEDWRTRIDRKDAAEPDAKDFARAAEPGRGREAEQPLDIPVLGWRDIAWRIVRSIPEDRIFATAGSVAFFTLLSFFPAVAVVVSLYGLFADASTIGGHLALLAGLLPEGVIALIRDQIATIVSKQTQTLSAAFAIGLGTALWSANSGIGAMFDALNVVYGEKEKRSILRFYATTFLFTVGAILFVIVAIASVVVLPIVLRFLFIPVSAEIVVSVARWPALLAVVMAALTLVYRFGPSRRRAEWKWVSLGSVGAAFGWIATSMAFSWYVASFDSYNKVYGSLGAGIGFMVWIWVSIVIVLIGAELNAEMEHQTARDTTTGGDRPLGQRGATMADHVGPAQ